jgi:microcystin-dependent protein
VVNPQTVNVGIIVPLTGADVDTWGEDDVNPNMVAIDGLFAGVQGISVTNVPITLTVPAGFVATPSAGPTQAQNRVLRFTGAMTGNVRVTLPLPGSYLIDNRTTGAFVLSFQGAVATEVVGIAQGEIVEIYNDGANVRFVNLGRVGALEFWGGISAIPAWVAACTVPPYLLSDGTVYNFSTYPALGARYLGQFGGNGVTTFGVQDLRGRFPLAYDGTGTRITVAGCGIDGQTLGAVNANAQSNTIAANQVPTLSGITGTAAVSVSAGGSTTIPYLNAVDTITGSVNSPGGGSGYIPRAGLSVWTGTPSLNGSGTISGTYTNASPQVLNNVPPAQVSGIWVVKT